MQLHAAEVEIDRLTELEVGCVARSGEELPAAGLVLLHDAQRVLALDVRLRGGVDGDVVQASDGGVPRVEMHP